MEAGKLLLLGTAEGVLVSTVLYAMAGPAVRPVIREKSQFRAQHDSLSLSSAHDSTSLYLHFRALGRPFLWAAYFFAPSFTLERMSADHLPQSSSSSRFTAGCFGFLLLRATALPFFGGIMSYQPVETLTHARMFRVRARLPYPIGPPDVFAMGVLVVVRAA